MPIVPQGGNTSMVGGAVPAEDGSELVLSTARLNRVRDLDPVDMTMTHRGRRHSESRAARRRRARLPAAAVDLLGRHRADRRRARGQCRRQQHRPLRQRPRPRARAGSRAAGRHDLERPAPAAQGQHRLLPAPVVRRVRGHARHHHRRGAETGAAAKGNRRGVLRRRIARGRADAVRPLPGARRGLDQRVRADVRPGHDASC